MVKPFAVIAAISSSVSLAFIVEYNFIVQVDKPFAALS